MSTTTTTTQNILPAWWEQYTKNLLGRAEKATSGDYVAYDKPRIAGFTPEQEKAFSLYESGMGSYQPYANAATAATNRAMGSFADPGVAGRYMNPYIQNVISGIGSTAARNLSENILPQINRTFVGGGTFGGSRSAEFTQRAIRDTQNAALSKQMEAMADAYKSAPICMAPKLIALFKERNDTAHLARVSSSSGSVNWRGWRLSVRSVRR
jgi:hypothetical protein